MRRHVRAAGRQIRCRCSYGISLRYRGDGRARRAQSQPERRDQSGSAEGIRDSRRHPDRHRSGLSSAAVLFGHAQTPRRQRARLDYPAGRMIWVSPALPDSTHDLNAARCHGLNAALTSTAIATVADKGHTGVGGAVGTPYKGSGLVGCRKTLQPLPREDPRCWRTRRRHRKRLAHPHESALQAGQVEHTGRVCQPRASRGWPFSSQASVDGLVGEVVSRATASSDSPKRERVRHPRLARNSTNSRCHQPCRCRAAPCARLNR